MPSPLVSVVMPAYRAAATVSAAIESVLAQTLDDFELVICDDASDDATGRQVLQYTDSRVRLLTNDRNMGEGFSRDRAIQSALGKWIAVIDADDVWEPHRLEAMLDATFGQENVAVFDDIMICHHTPNGLAPWRPLRGKSAFGSKGSVIDVRLEDYIQADRLLIKPVFPAAAVRNGQILHTRRRLGADNEYFIKLFLTGLTLRYLPEPMYMYRLMPGSATAKADGVLTMSACIYDCLTLPGLSASVRDAMKNKIASLRRKEAFQRAGKAFLAGRFFEALRVLLRHPQAILIAPKRTLRHLRYQLHRLRHLGSAR